MNRSEFLRSSVQLTCASCLGLMLHPRAAAADAPAPADPTSPVDEALKQAQDETAFVNHWLTDLFDTIDAELDPATRRKLMDGCGRGCFRRHKFKQDIAEAGKGDVGRLVAAYQKNFLVWREGDLIHIAYGTGKNTCFCPAARRRPGPTTCIANARGPPTRPCLKPRSAGPSGSSSSRRSAAAATAAIWWPMSADPGCPGERRAPLLQSLDLRTASLQRQPAAARNPLLPP